MINASDNNFQKILDDNKKVLADFWAPWCVPCNVMNGILKKIDWDYGENVKVVKVNVDECPQTVTNYGIRSIPSLLFFEDGDIQDNMVGIVTEDKIVESIKR
jgi:thioredoxin 1